MMKEDSAKREKGVLDPKKGEELLHISRKTYYQYKAELIEELGA